MPALPIRSIPDTRFDCNGCGDCCRSYSLGPVEPEVIAGLEEAGIDRLWPAAGEAPWHEERVDEEDGRKRVYLRRREGGCVFLRPDNLCAIHALLGAEAKPWFCRYFPFTLLAEPDAVTLALRRECSSWHRTRKDGTPAMELVPDLLSMIDRVPPHGFDPSGFLALPGVKLGGDYWRDLEERLVDHVEDSTAGPEATLASLRTLIHRLMRREPPEPVAGAYSEILSGLLDYLADWTEGALAETDLAADEDRVAKAVAATAWARQAAEGTRSGLAPANLQPEAAALLLDHLRHFIFGKEFRAMGELTAGLGAFLLDVAVARRIAEPGPDGTVSEDALASALVPWIRFSTNTRVLIALRLRQSDLASLFRENPAS